MTRPPRRLLVAAALIAFVAGAGCSSDNDAKITLADGKATTTVAETTDAPADTSDSDTSVTSDTTESTETTAAAGDVPAADPAECQRVSTAFSEIAASAAGMSVSDAQAAIDRMKAVLPEDLHDELDQAINASGSGDSTSAAAAMQKISQYVAGLCAGGVG